MSCSINLDFESFLGYNFNGGKSIRFSHRVSQPRSLGITNMQEYLGSDINILSKPVEKMIATIQERGFYLKYFELKNNPNPAKAKLDKEKKEAIVFLNKNYIHDNSRLSNDIIPHELSHIIIDMNLKYNIVEYLRIETRGIQGAKISIDLLLHPIVLEIMLMYGVEQEILISNYNI